MTELECDMRDWRVRTHLSNALLARYTEGSLGPQGEDALERHLLLCPCCQEHLIRIRQDRPGGRALPS